VVTQVLILNYPSVVANNDCVLNNSLSGEEDNGYDEDPIADL
jgi:hypothetical protein